ncbi:MAG: FG-GAP-like repeat-containing protein [Isosphaeraceae bacterium]
MLGLLCLAAIVTGGWYAFGAWRFRSELATARAEVARGEFSRARVRLAELSRRWPRDAAVEYGLGLCEHAEGRYEAALEAWRRVPAGAPETPVAALERGRLAIQLGRYREAEEGLRQAWSVGDAGIREKAYQQLGWLLQVEGRHRDVRRLIERAGDLSTWALRTCWLLDEQPVPVETIRQSLDQAARGGADDDRVWLAEANLAIRQGDLESADRWLTRCESARPEDPVAAQARLDWAIAADRPGRASRALDTLGPANLAPDEVPALRAWFARRAADEGEEHTALAALVALQPANTEALERLAEIEFRQGKPQRMADVRRRRAELDRIKERYRRLIADGDPESHPDEAARLAEALGRGYEARGWAHRWFRRSPSDREAQALLDRLAAARPSSAPAAEALSSWLDRARRGTGDVPHPGDGEEPVLIRFDEVGAVAGLPFTYENGRSERRHLPETMNGGVALLDYDGDGWLDVYAVQGGPFPPHPAAPARGDRLFRNRGDGSFEDATETAGVADLPGGYGHGAAAGDYDNDGDPDLFVARWRSYALLRNDGGRFVDATAEAGLSGERDWPTSAAFADLDGDGDLDLYVCHYLHWDPDNPKDCFRRDTNERTYCTPAEQPALPDHVFRNDGGRFVDVSRAAGIAEADTDGRGLGVVAAQLDDDLKIDVFVANDMSANFLFRNLGGWKFSEVAHASGAAGNAEGGYQAGMGVGCGDADGDGRVDLTVTNFYGEGTTLYHNLGGGLFIDRSDESGIRLASRYRLGFGTALLDADNDGALDLITANGHVNDLHSIYPYAMPIQLLRNRGDGRFRDVSSRAGEAFATPHVGRGLALGDLDNDGLLDVVVVPQNERLIVLKNRSPGGNHRVTLRLEGTSSNRDAVGAVVTVRAGGRSQTLQRFGGGSFESASDPRLHVGLGRASRVDEIEVRWPSGKVDRWKDLAADTGHLLREGEAPRPLAGFDRRRP